MHVIVRDFANVPSHARHRTNLTHSLAQRDPTYMYDHELFSSDPLSFVHVTEEVAKSTARTRSACLPSQSITTDYRYTVTMTTTCATPNRRCLRDTWRMGFFCCLSPPPADSFHEPVTHCSSTKASSNPLGLRAPISMDIYSFPGGPWATVNF